jgi:hypothetical protein
VRRGQDRGMNREERRHPEKHRNTKAPQERELQGADTPQDETSVRAKSSRHKKSTADKWNQ